ncbi:MAG: hypothetical protein GX456_12470 [Verrucomicrobia bacterium]|nr:hypothetical protein [Verrucomicrobiota bacterium]
MKTGRFAKVVSFAVAMSAFLCGCSKQSESTSDAGKSQKTIDSTVSGMQKSAGAAAEQAKEAVQATAAGAQNQASEVAAAAQAQVQTVIDQAKNLVNQGKHTEALSLLQQKLAGLKLTPEQQKLVDGLKEQIQKALSSAAKETTKTAQDLKKTLGQ